MTIKLKGIIALMIIISAISTNITALDEYARSLREIVNVISASGSEQLSMVQNIDGEISNISEVIRSASATAKVSASASEELTDQAATLTGLIGRFKL